MGRLEIQLCTWFFSDQNVFFFTAKLFDKVLKVTHLYGNVSPNQCYSHILITFTEYLVNVDCHEHSVADSSIRLYVKQCV